MFRCLYGREKRILNAYMKKDTQAKKCKNTKIVTLDDKLGAKSFLLSATFAHVEIKGKLADWKSNINLMLPDLFRIICEKEEFGYLKSSISVENVK